MLSVVVKIKSGITKESVLRILRRFFTNVKQSKEGHAYYSMTPEFRVVFDYDAMIVMIFPKKVAKGVTQPIEFIKDARNEDIVDSLISLVVVDNESSIYNKILESYGTSLENLTSDENNSVIISIENDGFDYFIKYNSDEEKINVLVTDMYNKKSYHELILATINAMENKIYDN